MTECPTCGSPNMEQKKLGYETTKPVEPEQGGQMSSRPPMTPEQFEAKMKKIWEKNDEESGHYDADDLMCRLLHSLGYRAGVKFYRQQGKWYA